MSRSMAEWFMKVRVGIPVAIWVILSAAGMASAAQEAICSNSAVFFCDNFEDRETGTRDLTTSKGAKNPGWALSDFTSMRVATNDKFDGTKSLEFVFPACSSTDPSYAGCGAGYMDNSPANMNRVELYFRHYVKWGSNWVWSRNGGKHAAMMSSGGGRAPWLWHHTWGSNLLHHIYEPVYKEYEQNVGTAVAFQAGRWYCLETHLKMSGGVIESWVDNRLVMSYSGASLNTAGGSWTSLLLSGYWNSDASGVSHPTMSRWFDNMVLSTQRIGCVGQTPQPQDAVAPAAPAGVVVR
jgi:hypothetical protein